MSALESAYKSSSARTDDNFTYKKAAQKLGGELSRCVSGANLAFVEFSKHQCSLRIPPVKSAMPV